MKSFLSSTAARGREESSYSVQPKQLFSFKKEAAQSSVKSCSFFFLLLQFVPLTQGASLLHKSLQLAALFAWLSASPDRRLSSICAVPQILYTCCTLLPLVPFKALNPPNPWLYMENCVLLCIAWNKSLSGFRFCIKQTYNPAPSCFSVKSHTPFVKAKSFSSYIFLHQQYLCHLAFDIKLLTTCFLAVSGFHLDRMMHLGKKHAHMVKTTSLLCFFFF